MSNHHFILQQTRDHQSVLPRRKPCPRRTHLFQRSSPLSFSTITLACDKWSRNLGALATLTCPCVPVSNPLAWDCRQRVNANSCTTWGLVSYVIYLVTIPVLDVSLIMELDPAPFSGRSQDFPTHDRSVVLSDIGTCLIISIHRRLRSRCVPGGVLAEVHLA